MNNRPPPRLLDATLVEFKPVAPLFRVHARERDPIEFNNSASGSARFSPIIDAATAQVIPTLYAGTTLDCALMETVFHDVPYSPGLKFIRKRTHLANRVFSLIELLSAITLVDLSSIALRKLGISRKHLLETEKDHYPASRAWAHALYSQFPAAQGLLWTSRQDDRAQACILFGSRIGDGILRPVSEPPPLCHPDGSARMEVLDLARRLNVQIVE